MPIDSQPCSSIRAAATGWGVNPAGYDYPFRSPGTDIRGLLTDFHLAYSVSSAVLPLRVAWIGGLNKALCQADSGSPGAYTRVHDVDVVVVDATNAVVFNSTTAASFSSTNFGTALRVHRWTAAGATCSIVQRVGWPTNGLAVPAVPISIAPADGVLDARCARATPRRLKSLTIGGTAVSSLDLLAGYNAVVTATPATIGTRRRTRLSVSLSPGLGAGTSPGCGSEDIDLRSINHAVADSFGNVTIAGDPCTWVRPATTAVLITRGAVPFLAVVPLDARLQLGDDCKPCCDCTDYANVQQGNLRVWNHLASAGATLNSAAIDATAIAARWAAAKTCREAHSLHMNVVEHDNRFLDIAAGLCNHAVTCLTSVEIRFTITGPGGIYGYTSPRTAVIADGRGGWISYSLETGTPAGTWSAFWTSVGLGNTVAVKFQATMVPQPGSGIPVTITATAYVGGVALPNPVTKVVVLNL